MKLHETKICQVCQMECHSPEMFCVRCGAKFDEDLTAKSLLVHIGIACRMIKNRDFAHLLTVLDVLRHILGNRPEYLKKYHEDFKWLISMFSRLDVESEPYRWYFIAESFMGVFSEEEFWGFRLKLKKLKALFDILDSLNREWTGKKISSGKALKTIERKTVRTGFSVPDVKKIISGNPQYWSVIMELTEPALFPQSYATRCTVFAREKLQKDETEEARKWFAEALKKEPNFYEAYEGQAELFIKCGDIRSAIPMMRKALELGSTNALTFNNLAWYLCEVNPVEEALENALWLALKAVEQVPVASYWDTLADVHERMDNIPEAIDACRKSIEIADPRSEKEYGQRMTRLCLHVRLRNEKGFCLSKGGGKSEKPIPSAQRTLRLCSRSAPPEAAGLPPQACECCSAPRPRLIPFLSRFLNVIKNIFNRSAEESFDDSAEQSLENIRDEPPVKHIRDVDLQRTDNSTADPVDCTVFSPPSAPQGQSVLIQVFAHTPDQKEEAAEMAKEFDDTVSRRGFRSLNMPVERGATIAFHLAMPQLVINDPVQEFKWNGRPESVQFEAMVPKDCNLGNVIGTVTASVNTVPLGHIKFKITVVSENAKIEKSETVPAGEQSKLYKKAFISYAAKDRDKVLARVQMLKSVGIDYFQDILDFEPGARWEKELYRHIDECDLFLLFWSSSAKESEWVLKEIKYALDRKGKDDFAPPEIRPVIIEGPPIVPPPENLSHLHFNDKLVYLMNKAG